MNVDIDGFLWFACLLSINDLIPPRGTMSRSLRVASGYGLAATIASFHEAE